MEFESIADQVQRHRAAAAYCEECDAPIAVGQFGGVDRVLCRRCGWAWCTKCRNPVYPGDECDRCTPRSKVTPSGPTLSALFQYLYAQERYAGNGKHLEEQRKAFTAPVDDSALAHLRKWIRERFGEFTTKAYRDMGDLLVAECGCVWHGSHEPVGARVVAELTIAEAQAAIDALPNRSKPTADTKTDIRKKIPGDPEVFKAAQFITNWRASERPQATRKAMLLEYFDGDEKMAAAMDKQLQPSRHGWVLDIAADK